MSGHEERVEDARTLLRLPFLGAKDIHRLSAALSQVVDACDAMKAERDAWKAKAEENHQHRAMGSNPKCKDYIARVEAERDDLVEVCREQSEADGELRAELASATKRAEEAEEIVMLEHRMRLKPWPGRSCCPICRRALGKGEG